MAGLGSDGFAFDPFPFQHDDVAAPAVVVNGGDIVHPPSDIILALAGQAGLEASAQAMEFRSGYYKATLFVDALETTLHADVSRAQRDALHLAVDTRITVNLPEEHAVLFGK